MNNKIEQLLSKNIPLRKSFEEKLFKELGEVKAKRLIVFLSNDRDYRLSENKEKWVPVRLQEAAPGSAARKERHPPYSSDEILNLLPREIHIECYESGSAQENFVLGFGLEENGGYYAKYYQKKGKRELKAKGELLKTAFANLLLAYYRYLSQGPSTLQITYNLKP